MVCGMWGYRRAESLRNTGNETIQHGAWETTKLVDGKLCCGPYATTVPRSLLVCTNESEAC